MGPLKRRRSSVLACADARTHGSAGSAQGSVASLLTQGSGASSEGLTARFNNLFGSAVAPAQGLASKSEGLNISAGVVEPSRQLKKLKKGLKRARHGEREPAVSQDSDVKKHIKDKRVPAPEADAVKKVRRRDDGETSDGAASKKHRRDEDTGSEKVSEKKRRREGLSAAKDAPEKENQEAPLDSTTKMTEEERKERDARTIFVGNVPLDWDKKKILQFVKHVTNDVYEGSFKPIWFRDIPLQDKYSTKNRKAGAILGQYRDDASNAKSAYMVLSSAEAVRKVCKVLHGLSADPRHVLRADGVGASARFNTLDRKRSVFVGNLPATTSEADIRDALKSAGEVDVVRIVRDRVTKQCKGFAFARFHERWSVKAALQLWGTEIQGRPIRVMRVEEGKGSGKGGGRGEEQEAHPAEMRIWNKTMHRHRSKGSKANENRLRSAKKAAKARKKEGRDAKKRNRHAADDGSKRNKAYKS